MKTEYYTELIGRTACPGLAVGNTVVVLHSTDLDRVKIGDVLVAAETDISFVAAMQRAAAVVTECGGRFCHAAIWARENNKPTVLQVKNATSILEGKHAVTVDATAGKIFWKT